MHLFVFWKSYHLNKKLGFRSVFVTFFGIIIDKDEEEKLFNTVISYLLIR